METQIKQIIKNKKLGVWKINFLATDQFGLFSNRKLVEAESLQEAKSKLNSEYNEFWFVRAKRLK